ncbi:MAG: leucyl aminopeptidase [Alphaproteobacteria bacterium]
MRIAFAEPTLPRTGVVVIGVADGNKLARIGADLDKKSGGGLARAMKASRFVGKKGQSLVLPAPAGLGLDLVILIGLGKAKALDALAAQAAGGAAMARLGGTGAARAVLAADPPRGCKLSHADLAANMAYGARLRGYRFDKYRTREKKEDKPSLASLAVQAKGAAAARKAFARLDAVAEGVFLTRDLVSEPSNVKSPKVLAGWARALAKHGVKVEVLGQKRMRELGMGALLGVAQGSAREPQLVVMRWNGDPKAADKRPVALVGKGVTFDSGGISIKPAGGMEDMKWDMGGAGVVIGVMRALAARKAKVNAVGVVGLVENMPSGTAQRPGDVVTSYSGQTIEVINTDAEGRLVLADAIAYCEKRFKPRLIVDLATLTGAIIICLGSEFAGLFSDDDSLAGQLADAGIAEGEKLWRMPLTETYDKQISSPIADMSNVSAGRGAGSSTAAQFLKRFVKDVPWAHLDIAGVTWSKKDAATVPKGGTAFGVRLLDRFLADNYEG